MLRLGQRWIWATVGIAVAAAILALRRVGEMQLTRERQAQPNVVASATPNTSVFPEQRRGDESFEEWLSASVPAGRFRTVEFLQYIGQRTWR